MKKIVLCILMFFLIMPIFSGCSGNSYSLKKSNNEIEFIEIVSAQNSLEYTVIKTLSEMEKEIFLEKFQTIEFQSYYVGDPMEISGDAIKITYENGSYEMVCYYWAEYVEDGEAFHIRKNCDKEAFNELINSFLKADITEQ